MKNTILSGIYSITCISNKKIYIGYSENIKKRWQNHRYKLSKQSHTNSHLQNAYNKYGKSDFVFAILKIMNSGLLKEQYEKEEINLIMYYKTTESAFGFNVIIPGSLRLKKENENKIIRIEKHYYCIDIITKEVTKIASKQCVNRFTKISLNRISDLCGYWKNINKRKSYNGFIVVHEDDYLPTFDYVNFKKIRTDYTQPNLIRKPPRINYIKKDPKDIIPYSDRNIKRCKIEVLNIKHNAFTFYNSILECSKDFNISKIYKCINNDYCKYKHRGCYFRRVI